MVFSGLTNNCSVMPSPPHEGLVRIIQVLLNICFTHSLYAAGSPTLHFLKTFVFASEFVLQSMTDALQSPVEAFGASCRIIILFCLLQGSGAVVSSDWG